MAARTMNTLLHVYEAYTELYRVDRRPELAGKLRRMLDIFSDRVYNPSLRRLEVFFDSDMNSLIDLNSYGHDIEASWLIDRGTEILGDPEYIRRITPITGALADHIHSVAVDDNSLYNECENGHVDTRKVWWVQAEAVLGFLNGYEKDNSRTDYLITAGRIWDFIRDYVIDRREGSGREWYNELHRDGTPITAKEMAGPWKCPYHNGRMCLEILRRNIAF